MINKNIKRDQRLLESMVNKYGKEDVIRYVKKLNESTAEYYNNRTGKINEDFNDSFSDNESDYFDIAEMNDRLENCKKKIYNGLIDHEINFGRSLDDYDTIGIDYDNKSKLYMVDLPNTKIEIDYQINDIIEDLIEENDFKIRTCKELTIRDYGSYKKFYPEYFDGLPGQFTSKDDSLDIYIYDVKLDNFYNGHPFNINDNLISIGIEGDEDDMSAVPKLIKFPLNLRYLYTNAYLLKDFEPITGIHQGHGWGTGDKAGIQTIRKRTQPVLGQSIYDSLKSNSFVNVPEPWASKLPGSSGRLDDKQMPLLSLKFPKETLQDIAAGKIELFKLSLN